MDVGIFLPNKCFLRFSPSSSQMHVVNGRQHEPGLYLYVCLKGSGWKEIKYRQCCLYHRLNLFPLDIGSVSLSSVTGAFICFLAYLWHGLTKFGLYSEM